MNVTWNPNAATEDPDHWQHVLGANYAGFDCKHCGRSRVLRYEEVNRLICEKCGWDQDTGDYAIDYTIR